MIEKISRLLRIPRVPMLKLIDPKILSFGVVGAVGFVVDAFLLTVLTIQFGWDVLPSRTGSFACATVVTWSLNRMFTFSRPVSREPQARKKEYFLYLTVQVVGAALNFVVFFALIEWNPVLRQMPIIPLAGGAVIALVFNFTMSRKFVFGNSGGLNE
ncbi:GtrA family protein [Candidatus Nitrotoga sp. HW29]|uniref:GtrA family protein n=1 Tax=Candidatus Nitrotoga sp. HW29 TaxID=2886963 RepID=UPI001EF19670|nr:GtrA family protein [Candidatus Nitrotoga sp. HW29]